MSDADSHSRRDETPSSDQHADSPAPNAPSGPSSRASSSYGWLLLIAVAAVLAIAFLRSPLGRVSPQSSPAVGKPAPQIELVKLTEFPMDRVSSTDQGEVMLVHFWGTWCGPCKHEYPELDQMVDQWADESRFRFVPISCESGPGETIESLAAKTQQYFDSVGIESFSYADPRGITRRSAAERLERSSMFFPTSILVDSDGKIAGVWEGYSPDGVQQMRQQIERLLQ